MNPIARMAKNTIRGLINFGPVREALRETELYAAGQVDDDDHLYRSARTRRRDLPPYQQERMIDHCIALYRDKLMGRRIPRIYRDFIVGEGIEFEAEDDDTRSIIEEFWNDSNNDLDASLGEFVIDQCITGELILPVFPNPVTGHVKIGQLDPKDVQLVLINPDNSRERVWVIVKGYSEFGGELRKRAYRIVDYKDGYLTGFDVKGEKPKLDEIEEASLRQLGESPDLVNRAGGPNWCFFFPVNRLLGSSRGLSDLYHMADWIDEFEEAMWNVMEREEVQNRYWAEAILKGADDKKCDDFMMKHKIPRPLSVFAHNENVEFKPHQPPSHQGEYIGFRTIKEQIAMAAELPEHWLAHGGGVTRTTAEEMGPPTYRAMKRRQGNFLASVRLLVQFQIDQYTLHNAKYAAKRRSQPEIADFKLTSTPVAEEDYNAAVTALKSLTEALQLIADNAWLPGEKQIEVLHSFLVSRLKLMDVDLKELLEWHEGNGGQPETMEKRFEGLVRESGLVR